MIMSMMTMADNDVQMILMTMPSHNNGADDDDGSPKQDQLRSPCETIMAMMMILTTMAMTMTMTITMMMIMMTMKMIMMMIIMNMMTMRMVHQRGTSQPAEKPM